MATLQQDRQPVRTQDRRRRPSSGRPAISGGVSPRNVRHASSCNVTTPARVASPSWALRLKVGAVMVLAVVGLGVSAVEFSSWAEPDPSVGYVQGDPAWAHVDGAASGR